MAIPLSDNTRTQAPKPTDDRFGPYLNVAAALAGVPRDERYPGLPVGIWVGGKVVRYVFESGVENNHLVLDSTAPTTAPYTAAGIVGRALGLTKSDGTTTVLELPVFTSIMDPATSISYIRRHIAFAVLGGGSLVYKDNPSTETMTVEITVTGGNGEGVALEQNLSSNSTTAAPSVAAVRSVIGVLSALLTTAKGNLVAALNELVSTANGLRNDLGVIAQLTTTAKTNVVAAINELREKLDTTRDVFDVDADKRVAVMAGTYADGKYLPGSGEEEAFRGTYFEEGGFLYFCMPLANGSNPSPLAWMRARLESCPADLEITDATKGLILRNAIGRRARVTLSNNSTGALTLDVTEIV